MRYTHENKAKGFTIIELLVAMTVFLIVIAITSGIFIRTIRTQRIITDMSASLNNVTLALEQITREARTGYAFSIENGGQELSFINAKEERVTYAYAQNYDIHSGQINRSVEGEPGESPSITSEGTNIKKLLFNVRKDINGTSMPTLVTIAVTTAGEGNIEVHLQTSVSSRVIGI